MDYMFTGGVSEAPALPAQPQPQSGNEQSPDLSFKDMLKSFFEKVNSLQHQADQKMKDFAAGNIQNIHEVFVAAEQAGLALRLALQLRDRIITAYTEVLRMQI